MKRYIISGAPGTGKTSLLRSLKRSNFLCFEEISRKVIMEQQHSNGNKTPWQDVLGFTELVYEQTKKDLSIPLNEISFVDRGLPDNIAYLKLQNKPISKKFLDFDYHRYYHNTVFILPPWKAIFKQDPQRLQSFEEALELHELLVHTYKKLRFSILELPKTSIRDRSNRVTNLIA